MQRLSVWVSCTAASAALLSGSVFSQETAGAYPSKPVTVIIPYAAAGPVDQEARLYATKMSGTMGQTFIADNKPGAATSIGTGYVAKAAPDGYTVLAVAGSLTAMPSLYKDLPFDILKDLAPITQMSQQPFIVMVNTSFPAKSFSEFIAYAKANPGKINWGTSGAGGSGHLIGAWILSSTNTQVTFVHYKGTGPVMLDLMAGRVDVAPEILSYAMPRIKSGKVRALATTDDKRSKLLPDLPTVAEQGIPGYSYMNWMGFAAPGPTPAAIVNKLNEGFAKVVHAPDVVSNLEANGGTAVGSTPAQFKQLIATETSRWRKIVQENGIKLEE